MEIKDLKPQEQAALVALLRFDVMLDGKLSDKEVDEIDLVADEMGEEAYRAAFDSAGQQASDIESLKELLKSVTNPEARELIFETLLEAALPTNAIAQENQLIDVLAELWGLEPEYPDLPEGD
ncbi:MAG: hypothetical protein MUF51_03190 [Vicinamibacteria bacterium]|jgi:hypothetical protein|nr:hypothetical protein [Vicinamibacteria bacterium]